MGKLRVAVLMGGTSAERTISLSTGRQIMAALDPAKYHPLALDAASLSGKSLEASRESRVVSREIETNTHTLRLTPHASPLVPLRLEEIARREEGLRPDVVFIALHGRGGEDGTIQGMLGSAGSPP